MVVSTKRLLAAQSWSVIYMGDAVDDARKVGGVWYRRHIVSRQFEKFLFQHRVFVLFKNPRF